MYRMQRSVEQLAVSNLFHFHLPAHPEIARRSSFDLADFLDPPTVPEAQFFDRADTTNLPYLPCLIPTTCMQSELRPYYRRRRPES